MSALSFDDRDGYIWMNGQKVDWREAKGHVLSHALHYASTVFEGIRVYDKKAFALEGHCARLIESARLLDFVIPYTLDQIQEACLQMVEANDITDGYLRPFAWRGSEQMGVSGQKNRIHLAVACWQWPSYFSPEALMKGLRLQVSQWHRPDPKTAPTKSKAAGLYMICTLSKHQAEAAGYDDALMLDWRGYVAEATGANIFFLMEDGRLHTPTPDCFLNGITRQTVIELARQAGYEVVERHIPPDDLGKVKEAFLTGTAVEVAPISEIGSHRFTPGDCSRTLIDSYAQHVRA